MNPIMLLYFDTYFMDSGFRYDCCTMCHNELINDYIPAVILALKYISNIVPRDIIGEIVGHLRQDHRMALYQIMRLRRVSFIVI